MEEIDKIYSLNDDDLDELMKNGNFALKQYINEISRYPLLELEEEKEIGTILYNTRKSIFIILTKKGLFFDYKKLFSSLSNIEIDKELLELLKQVLINSNNSSFNNILDKYIKLIINNKLDKNEINKKFKITKNYNIGINIIKNNLKDLIIYLENRQKLINSNLRLVVHYAFKYDIANSSKILDIINDGNIGLMKAVDKFDVTKGFKFSTYATFWITQQIERELPKYKNTIITSKYIEDCIKEFNIKVKELEEKTNKKYTARELSEMFNIEYDRVVAYLNYTDISPSLDEKIEDDLQLYDVIPNKNNEHEKLIKRLADKEYLELLFEGLTNKQKEVLKYRNGIDTENNKTYTTTEIADMYNVSYQAIQQTEKNAIERIRKIHKKFIKTIKNDY